MKIIEVKVIPNAKKNSVKEEEGLYRVHLTAPPVDGKANKALIEILSEYFKVKKSQVTIVKGETGRNKKVEIAD